MKFVEYQSTMCKKCVLTTNYPGMDIGDDGVCNYCAKEDQKLDRRNKINSISEDNEKKFAELIKNQQHTGDYDCILAFSGGKDSTYTLFLLKEKYKLNILTYTFDNGFLSDQAKDNIKRVVEKLDVDNIIFSPKIDLLKKMFIESAVNDQLYSQAALMRASAVCTTCINFIRYSGLKVCIQKNVPLLIFGWAPGQIDERSIIFKPNKQFLLKSQNIFTEAHKQFLGNDKNSYFMSNEMFQDSKTEMPYFVNPLLFNKYNYDKVTETIFKLGWKYPDNTDASSTNCLLNTLGNFIHEKKCGYNPYVQEISQLIRENILTREEGIEKLNKEVNSFVLESCLHKLGIEEGELC